MPGSRVVRQFEGGKPINMCWASKYPFSSNEYGSCDMRPTHPIGLCAEHVLSIIGCRKEEGAEAAQS